MAAPAEPDLIPFESEGKSCRGHDSDGTLYAVGAIVLYGNGDNGVLVHDVPHFAAMGFADNSWEVASATRGEPVHVNPDHASTSGLASIPRGTLLQLDVLQMRALRATESGV